MKILLVWMLLASYISCFSQDVDLYRGYRGHLPLQNMPKEFVLEYRVFYDTTISSSSSSSSDVVYVPSYTRKDGTRVKSHTRKYSSSSYSDVVYVSGYTRKDGTRVKSYTRSKPRKK